MKCPPLPGNPRRGDAGNRAHRTMAQNAVSPPITDRNKLCSASCRGGVYLELRASAARALAALDLPGYAIGGVSVGEPPELIEKIVRATTPPSSRAKTPLLDGGGETYREMAQANRRWRGFI